MREDIIDDYCAGMSGREIAKKYGMSYEEALHELNIIRTNYRNQREVWLKKHGWDFDYIPIKEQRRLWIEKHGWSWKWRE